MASDLAVAAETCQARPQADLPTLGDQCDPVCVADRMPMANAAGHFPQLEHGIWGFLAVAK
jgi:hypothetical protein